MCPDWKMNWRPFGLQADAQSSEPHQPGQPQLFHPLIYGWALGLLPNLGIVNNTAMNTEVLIFS